MHLTDERDNEVPIAEVPRPAPAPFTPEGPIPAAGGDTSTGSDATGERAPWLAPYRWQPGVSGNPTGRPRESGSLAAALRRVGVKPAKTRAELGRIAQQLGMDPDEARNIDVIAGLVYDGITQLLIRTVKGSAAAGDKLVGLLQLLSKALDGDERQITINNSQPAYLASLEALRRRLVESARRPASSADDQPEWPGPNRPRLTATDRRLATDALDGDEPT
jgi:hypothetical protein